jgi:heme-degrading monooxygenase HmoA
MKTNQSSQNQIIEFAPFELKESIDAKALLTASETLQREFLENQRGFIKRELVKKSASEYVDIVYWDNKTDADNAVEHAMKSTVFYSYFQLMKETDHHNPGAGVSHFEIIGEYNKTN